MVSLNEKIMNLHKSILLLGLLGFGGCSDDDTIAKPDGPNIITPPEGNPSVLPPQPPAVIEIAEGEYDGYYYGSSGNAYELENISDKFFIILKEADLKRMLRQLADNDFTICSDAIWRYDTKYWTHTGFPAELFDCVGMEIEGDGNIEQLKDLVYYSHLYYDRNSAWPDMVIGSSNYVYLRIFRAEDIEIVDRYARDMHLYIINRNGGIKGLDMTLVCTTESAGTHVQVANYLHETGLFDSVQPEFNFIIFI